MEKFHGAVDLGNPTPAGQRIPDRGPTLVSLTWSLTAIALLTGVLRLLVRKRRRSVGWDDVFMILAMGFFVAWSVFTTIYTINGGARHLADLALQGPDNLARVELFVWLAQACGVIGSALGKVSVSVLLLNIIGVSYLKWQRWYLWIVTIVLTTTIAVAGTFILLLQCRPARRLWDRRVDGTCLDPDHLAGMAIFIGSWNTFADASLAIIPLTIFWNLNLGVVEKIQLSIVFGLNIVASVCSGVRTQFSTQYVDRSDITWRTYDTCIWGTIEFFFVVVCGTIPTLNPLFKWVRHSLGLHSSRISESLSSVKRGSVFPGGPDHEMGPTGSQPVGKTVTTIRRGEVLQFGESDENLVEGSTDRVPSSGVRVEVEYHVKESSRVHSFASSQPSS